MAKSIPQHNSDRRKCPKRCTVTIYHAGAVILFVGITVAIAGIATGRLFHVFVYDHRKPARFLQVHVPVGLFSVSAQVTWLSLKRDNLEHGLDLSDSRWRIAQMVTMIGLLLAIVSFILHTIVSCCHTRRIWTTVMFEVCGLLLAVIAILIGLTLAESEIEYIHDHGDVMLTRFLKSNQLLLDADVNLSDPKRNSVVEAPPVNDLTDQRGVTNGGDFALFLTTPQISFALLIAADFLILIAFLAVLIYFVRLCEVAVQTRKQLRRAETSQI